MKNPVFITGNTEKAHRFSELIGLNISHQAVDLSEIQTIDHRELVEHKVRQAYETIKKPVLVEDVFFSFKEWGSLPGPFVKFFVDAPNGVEKMCRMLDGFTNRRAVASCIFGYFDGDSVHFFEGSIEGEVTDHPRGHGGYGFDRIFIPDGFDGKTAAELNADDYDKYYQTIKPFAALRRYFKTI